MGFNVVNQKILVFAHAEEIVRFNDFGDVAAAFGAFAVDQVFFSEKAFVADAIPALVFRLVDFAAVVKILKHLLHDCLMSLVGGADEFVVGDAEFSPEFLKTHDGFVAVGLGRHLPERGRFLDFLPVFVGAGQKKGRHIERPVITGQHVGQNRRVGVADMRFVVDVVNRGGDVKMVIVHRIGMAPVKKQG